MSSHFVLLDTDVFSALHMSEIQPPKRQTHPVESWANIMFGRRVVISFQTRAEILTGAYVADWGEKKMHKVHNLLNATPTIHADLDIVDEYAKLVANSKVAGHPFNNLKEHVGDRWIAACAIAKNIPLLTGNLRHYQDAPGLEILI